MREALLNITTRLRSGASLATAMQEHGTIFSSIFVSLVHVGENTGRLDEAFKRLMQHIELERETRNRVSQALRYPSIVFSAMVIAMGIINLFVIPNFSKVFKKLGQDLPLPTQILMKTSEFTVNYWWLILLVAAGGAVAAISYIKTDEGRLRWDMIKLRIPIIGSILNKIALSRFTRSFAMMAESGVPLVQSLGIVGSTLGNRYIESSISSIRRGVERGDSLARSAAATHMFTPLIIQMISVGEETGAIDKLLHDVSDFYEEEVDFQLKKLADAIEPIVLTFMGALVLVLALGVFLPMWELGAAMKK
jgi:MSHA biogenesis protein MshG